MQRAGLLALLMGAALGLSACAYVTGKPISGINSSAPEAVKSAASGATGGGSNQFTHAQISPGSPAGANINLQPQPPPL
jgi:hypothetical protein